MHVAVAVDMVETASLVRLGLPKFGSVQFFDHFAWTANLNLQNRFYRFKNWFELLNFKMVNNCRKQLLFAFLTFFGSPIHLCQWFPSVLDPTVLHEACGAT
jgi:hypothetical protein